jgi:drug/metabolite transporter (DMT)-like permease
LCNIEVDHMLLILGAILCVIAVAAGQVLFKAGAVGLGDQGISLAVKPLMLIAAAFLLYFLSSLGWVLVLRKAPLGQIYPVMALSFILVPLASYALFGEQFSSTYFIGVSLIVAGIIFCVQS